MKEPVPVVLFAYARPRHLGRVLACLRENRVPLILAYADGARGGADAAAVSEARALLRAVDWCELRLVGREKNLGLGRNVPAGVTETAAAHDAFVPREWPRLEEHPGCRRLWRKANPGLWRRAARTFLPWL